MKHYYDIALSPRGPIPNPAISVYIAGTSQGTLASIFSDNGITPKANPFLGDGIGNFDFYVADGRYDLKIISAGVVTRLETDIEIADITQFSSGDQPTITPLLGFSAAGATTPDAGISRLAAGSLAIGLGTPGDTRGTLQLASIQGPGFQRQIFTSSGTFTIPTGTTQVKVTVVGGGGGGGGTANSSAGAGGGGGGAAIKWLTSLTPGNTLSVTVGNGGNGGASGANPGLSGGSSTVSSGTQVISTITGGGGTGGATGFNVGAAGGIASGGDLNFTGCGSWESNATPDFIGSLGGASIFGWVGPQTSGGGAGSPGAANSGAGGGGASGNAGAAAGGNGGNGIVIFEWVS